MALRELTPALPAARALAEALGAGDSHSIDLACAWVEAGRAGPAGAALISLWRAANPDLDALGAPPSDPDPGDPAILAWCEIAGAPPDLDPRTDSLRVGWIAGIVRDRYLHRGWMAAALAAAQWLDGRTDDLAEEIAGAAVTGLVERITRELAGIGDTGRQYLGLGPSGLEPPLPARISDTLARLVAAARRADPGPIDFDRALGTATWLVEGDLAPVGPAAPAPDRCELAESIATTPRDALAWLTDDPLAVAKAVARGAADAAAWIDLLDGARLAIADHGREVIGVAWTAAVASARSRARVAEPSPLAASLVTLGETVAARACARIGETLAGCRAGRLEVARLVEVVIAHLGPPEGCRETWGDALALAEVG